LARPCLEIARSQQSPILELRALLSLMCISGGDDVEPERTRLLELEKGMEEGRSTPDLVEARRWAPSGAGGVAG